MRSIIGTVDFKFRTNRDGSINFKWMTCDVSPCEMVHWQDSVCTVNLR